MKKLMMFLTFFISGCAVAPFVVGPIITGVIMWKQGEARKFFNEDILIIYRATKNSLKELDYPIKTDSKIKDGYYIVAGDRDRFKITVRNIKPKVVEVSIRINLMGDKENAELLYKKIDANTNTIFYNDKGEPVKNTYNVILTDLP